MGLNTTTNYGRQTKQKLECHSVPYIYVITFEKSGSDFVLGQLVRLPAP